MKPKYSLEGHQHPMGVVRDIMILMCIFLIIALWTRINKTQMRLPDNNQPLATTCYVDEKISRLSHDFGGAGRGYFIRDGERYEAKIVVETPQGYLVDYQVSERIDDWIYTFNRRERLSKDEFYKYYSLKEISEIINNNKCIKK